MKRCIVLVLDGFGVGAMPDIVENRPQDIGAHTLANLYLHDTSFSLPFFESCGIKDYYVTGRFHTCTTHEGVHVSLGKNALQHQGADSYMGHQEIVGTRPQTPTRQFVRNLHQEIVASLQKSGYEAKFNGRYIIVNDCIAVADNIETDYGLNINVVGSLDAVSYETIRQVGEIVRNIVKVGRVITMGGRGIDAASYEECFEVLTRDGYTAWGINIPKLHIYNEHYQVVHMGYGIDPNVQVTQILRDNDIRVTLIGKTADVIRAEGASYQPAVQTEIVLKKLKAAMKTNDGFIFANVQETDLSGHLMDSMAYMHHLSLVDKALFTLLKQLNEEDMFIITGDHGNDPHIKHTNHTREYTPLIVFSKQTPSQDLGTRNTLSDIGATVAAYFGVDAPENGAPIIELLSNSA